VDSHISAWPLIHLQLFSSWMSRPEVSSLCSFSNGHSKRNICEAELQDTSHISIM